MKKYTNIYLVLILFGVFMWSACHKLKGPVMNYAIATPDSLSMSVDKQKVKVNWEYPSGEPISGFIVQLAVDKEFKQIIAKDTLSADTKSVTFDSTGYRDSYCFRIMARAKNVAQNSDFVSTYMEFGNIMVPIKQTDITSNSVTLQWNLPDSGLVTSIILIPDDSLPMNPVEISTSEQENRKIEIDNLKPLTKYTALIQNKDSNRIGVGTFKTKDPNAIITINSGEKIYSSLKKAITVATSGDVIHVGGNYDLASFGSIKIDKSLTIQGRAGIEKPRITYASFSLSGNVKYFKLYRLKLIVNASHAIDLSAVSGMVNVSIDSCNVSGSASSGLIYASSDASKVSYGLKINNSLFHDFGKQDGDFIDFRAGTLTDIELKNSTFWNLARRFLRLDEDVKYTGKNTQGGKKYAGKSSGNPAAIHNCTIYNVASKTFVRQQISNFIIHVNECILTDDLSSGSELGIFVNGYANANNTFGTNANGWFDGWGYWNHLTFSPVTNTTHLDPQFVDPDKGNFTIGNKDLKALGLGDPRWLK